MGLPYAMNNGNLGKFLKEVASAPVPAKVDYKYLETRGYKGANDKYLVSFLKSLRFIDNAGVPLDRWHDHRHSGQSQAVHAAAVRDAYSGFFEVYPDAPKRTEEEFTNWARVEDSKASPTTIKRSWATFRAMFPMSDFEAEQQNSSSTPEHRGNGTQHHSGVNPAPMAAAPTSTSSGGHVQVGAVGGITINIELQLPASADAKFFDQFFASMRKHLIAEDE